MDIRSNLLFKKVRDILGSLHREIRVLFTPDVNPEKWVFIVGCYNSGTTLLSELLSAHEQISTLPTEGHFLTNEFVKDYEVGIPRMWAEREELFRLTEKDEGPDHERIKNEWRIRLNLKKPIFLEKSPPNTPRVRWLQEHFKPAYFIVIVRNGYAVSEGIYRKADPKHLKNSWPIDMCARQWRRSYEILHEDEPYLSNVLWVKYEDLTKNSIHELNRICNFIGINHFTSIDETSSFKIHEREESIKDMNQESIDRLNFDQIEIINEVAGDYLKKLGYPIIDSRIK